MKTRCFCLLLLFSISLNSFAQKAVPSIIEGKVFEIDQSGKVLPLVGVNLYWLGTQRGAISDSEGMFSVERVAGADLLVFSYVGFDNDTVRVIGDQTLDIEMKSSLVIDEVSVVSRQKSTIISMLDPRKVEQIGEKELLKAACCNLSESFETSPSIDVAFTDAVTGTRQIQMLGLSGPYVQITKENMPGLRGLASNFGLTFFPGTWIEGIQLNKGTGSVLNGFESIAGQINLELRKPEEADPLYLNLFANNESRLEANLNLAHRFKDSRWSTALLLHASERSKEMDENDDGFMDMPTGDTYILLNRWKYNSGEGIEGQFGVKHTSQSSMGGQMGFNPNKTGAPEYWGMELDIQHSEAWAKLGKVFVDKPWKSIAMQMSGSYYEQNSTFGETRYNADQQSYYMNSIYQSIIGNSFHQFKTGISFQYDLYREYLNDTDLGFSERISGAYFEYTFKPSEQFSLVAGLRTDHHNSYGWFATPRLHVRYAPSEKSVIRLSAGRGMRTANVIMENSGVLASSRELIFQSQQDGLPYGFEQEVAWNFGTNFTQNFEIDYRHGSITFDLYRTNFENQVVVDLDLNPQQAVFAPLDGKSYATSFQAQLDYELVKRLDFRIAYRYYDVKTTYHGELLEKALLSKQRAFVNLAYQTRNYWRFDLTLNRQGKKRIPGTESNPEEYRLANYSPAFNRVNVQVSKNWKESFELYLGVENLTNYKQDNPIVASEDPFGPYFDSSMVWGPIWGRTIYMGLRYKIF
ncbi:TonB-dependent receptor [Mangrovibacterium lignilyticum]|uniref:TonB-dependent receptor n=1 Tax=Mangrovibacterium lignilyticum TaxID=2668052 RepID=UPI0013D88A2A|nr:TonB-dependent receptor [Mangrovibacterium lignilyticum]